MVGLILLLRLTQPVAEGAREGDGLAVLRARVRGPEVRAGLVKVLPEVVHALAGARQDLYVGEEVRAVHAQLLAHAVGGILLLVVGE
eukprot:14889476-Alexandrium_andersonii.AAC.1